MKIEKVDNSIYVIDDFLTDAEERGINLQLKGLCGDTIGQTMMSYHL